MRDKTEEAMNGRWDDAMVAELLFGWKWFQGPVFPPILWTEGSQPPDCHPVERPAPGAGWTHKVPKFHSDASADYSVLDRARRTWNDADRDAFALTLYETWEGRLSVEDRKRITDDCLATPVMYQPGDYSRCALMVLESASP